MPGAHEAPRKENGAQRSKRENKETPDRNAIRAELYEPMPPAEQREPAETGSGPAAPKKWVVPVASALCVILVLVMACAGFVYYTATLDTIYPNVLLDGLSVGGATPEAAEMLLQSRGLEGYGGKSITVNLPMGESLTVQAEQLGLGGTPAAAVAAAYAYGRDGDDIQNAINYLKCFWGQGVNILWQGSGLDAQALQQIVTETAEPLNRRLDSAGADIGEESVTFTKGAGAMEVDAQELTDLIGLAFAAEDYADISYVPEINGEANVELENLFAEIHTEPTDASYDKQTGQIIESVQGLTFDLAAARDILDATTNGEEVYIPLTHTEPAISTEMMQEYLFRDRLSSKGTSLSGSSSARINNLTLAAAAMNGTVLLPGEEFSYNDCLGQRTAAKGYQAAGVYSDGRHTTDIGGGICQGSSTLYYCALYANLEITERWDHYFSVSYLPMGLDATVSWYSPNFRFVNSLDYPIRIDSWIEGGYFYVEIWGTNLDGSYVQVSTDGWEDAEFYYAMSYRNVYAADGTLIRAEDGVYSRYHKYEKTDDE